jgi:hypothetical protein
MLLYHFPGDTQVTNRKVGHLPKLHTEKLRTALHPPNIHIPHLSPVPS